MASTDPIPSARTSLLRAAEEELDEKGHASVSLRAVARRAGVSHAAPAHFFGDRAGMLTAVATSGFDRLADALEADADRAAADGESPLTELGRTYVRFGLQHPALVDLMFRRSELVPDDTELIAAQQRSLAPLSAAVEAVAGADPAAWSLISWAVVHGLVSLAREGMLAQVAGRDPESAGDLALELVARYADGVAAASTKENS